MYRIELSPGEETAFRSIEELAVAIRRKVVTSHARIYHNATSRWLPIQFHPHYKIALSMPLTQADLVAGPPVTPLSKLTLGESQAAPVPDARSNREAATQAALAAWPEPKPSVPVQPVRPEPAAAPLPVKAAAPEPPPRRAVEPRGPTAPVRSREPERRSAPPRIPEYQRLPEPIGVTASVRAQGSRRRSKPRRPLRVALAGVVLIACAQLVLSGLSAPRSEPQARLRTPRQLISAPGESLSDATPRTVAAVMPGFQSIPVPGFKSPAAAGSAKISAPARSNPVAEAQPMLPPPLPTDSSTTTVPELEAAPEPAAITSVTGPLAAESLATPLVDSSSSKALKGILRTITGSPAAESKPPKR